MKQKLKNLSISKKLQVSFRAILSVFIFAAVFALIGVAMINANLKRFYKESYQNSQLQLEIRRDVQLVGKNILWAITTTDSTQQERIKAAETYSLQMETSISALSKNFSKQDKIASLTSAFETLNNERLKIVELLAAGNQADAFTAFNSSYDDATENIQNVLIEIGAFASKQADTAYSRATNLVIIINIIMLINAVTCVVRCITLSDTLTKLLLSPIHKLQNASQKLKDGDLNIDINYNNTDELGELAQNFQEACLQIRTVISDTNNMLGCMADGNFNVDSSAPECYKGDFEALLVSIRKMNSELSNTLQKINQTSAQVMNGSGQLASSAQSLAEGATEQAGAVQELLATISDVTGIAEGSLQESINAANDAKSSAEHAAASREEINELTGAMERINETSRQIEDIIAAIEDIASQTNLLSLNASIEAARAGEAGRGFAVVADQIGKLASDSAQSAVTTKELISKSLVEIENGNQIVNKTVDVISEVLQSMEGFATMASNSAESSKSQTFMLKQIEQEIDQISSVVENNSASAEENSAISQELSAQAQTLEQMIAAFELRN